MGERVERLILKSRNISFGEVSGIYFIEDACRRVYLTAKDRERIVKASRLDFLTAGPENHSPVTTASKTNPVTADLK